MDELRIEKLSMEDGRQAERHIKEEGYCEDEQKRVIDLYVEPERPKRLAKRITEQRRPCVVRREIETVDENGDVIDRKIESIDPEDKMRLVEHIATYGDTPELAAQSATDDCGCPITREDLKDVMGMLVKKMNGDRANQQVAASNSVSLADIKKLAAEIAAQSNVKSQSIIESNSAPEVVYEDEEGDIDVVQDHVRSKVSQKNETEVSNTTWWLLMCAVAQIAGLTYIWVLM